MNLVFSKVSDEMVPVMPSAPPDIAELSIKQVLLNMEFTNPLSKFIAPPIFFSARLLKNETLMNVAPSTFAWKLMAPPSLFLAVLFTNFTFSKVSDVDAPVTYNAPPFLLSVLFSNVIFSNKLFVDAPAMYNAPPFPAAVLLMKFKFVNLLSDKAFHTLIAPPHPSVFPFLKVILFKVTPVVALSSKILILPNASMLCPLPLIVIELLITIPVPENSSVHR